ncbi:transposase [Leadbettera azotonutricia]|uniref:transposase n=1 Tax=Leadbettera azotonutricia TaxID=150829 RepID=UPI001FE11825|nr:transposase [Leadbettera azotonutricia]
MPVREYERNLSQEMREKIDKKEYRKIYSKRMQIIEPVFADITYCKGMDRFTMRSKAKVDIQWKLYCIMHNIGKFQQAKGKKNAV